MQYINGPTVNPKNSHKDFRSVLKINFTMLQKYKKIVPIKYARKYITLTLQHGNNQGLANYIDQYHSYQPPLSNAQLLCIHFIINSTKNLTYVKIK